MQVTLCEDLEQKMKVTLTLRSVAPTYCSFQDTEVETAIADLFVGHYSAYVKCRYVPYTSSHREPYMGIELNVSGCRNVYESLKRSCAEEMLEGAHKYYTDKYGAQVRSHSLNRRASIE